MNVNGSSLIVKEMALLSVATMSKSSQCLDIL